MDPNDLVQRRRQVEGPNVARQPRIEFIDVARGVFLYWMTAAHCLGLARVPDTSWMQYLRPSGWATTCFIMLSGMSTAVVFLNPERDHAKTRRRLRRRAAQIGVIAYVSNAMLTTLKTALAGTLSMDVLLQILSFRYPWSISSVLLPVFLLLLAAPWLIRLAGSQPPWLLVAGAIVLNLMADLSLRFMPSGVSSSLAYQICFLLDNPLGFFPLVRFFLLGVLGLSVGTLVKKAIIAPRTWWTIAPVSFALILYVQALPDHRQYLPSFLVDAAQFLLSTGLALALLHVHPLRALKNVLAMLGRSSLLVFILHRPVVQASALVLSATASAEWLGAALTLSTLSVCLFTCWFREHFAAVGVRLKSIGF